MTEVEMGPQAKALLAPRRTGRTAMPRTEAEAYDEVAQKVIASYTESVQAALRRHFVAAERERIAREVEAWSAPSGLMGDFYVTKSAVLAIVNPEGEG